MPDLPEDLVSLSNEAAIHAIQRAGIRYLELCGVAVEQIGAGAVALARDQAPSVVSELDATPNDRSGALARTALAAMLSSDDKRAARVARAAVDEARQVSGQEIITAIIVGGSFLIALALASKVSYSRDKGLEIATGFPGLAEVLEKTEKLVSAAIGAAQKS